MTAEFPVSRPRRLRRTPALRSLVRENRVDVKDLIYPLFVVEGKGISQEIPSMPGIRRLSPDLLPREIEGIAAEGIPGVLLFGIPAQKDELGTAAYREDGVVQQAVRIIKQTVPELIVAITDVCLCEYTDHGHCGVVIRAARWTTTARCLCWPGWPCPMPQAGADIVAPRT